MSTANTKLSSKKSEKASKSKRNNFQYQPSQNLPGLSDLKTEWALDDLFYKGPADPKLELDVKKSERAYSRFAKKYSDKRFIKTNVSLLESLREYRKLHDSNLDKVFVFLFLCRERNSSDLEAEQVLNQLQQRVTTFTNRVLFYELIIGKLPEKRQQQLLKDEKFGLYHHLLRNTFNAAKHNLTEAEEKILSLKALTSRHLWISGTEKIVNNAQVTVQGREMPLNAALMEIADAPRVRRHALWSAAKEKLKEIGPVAENELNALYLDKKISDELRGYAKPYSATLQSFETTEKSLAALTEAVTTKGYRLSQRFYKLKAQLLNTKQVLYIDRDDLPNRLPPIDFKTSVAVCRDAFYSFNPVYGQIFDEMLQGGHIDVYPRRGKGGGAFSIGSVNTPTMVMLNHSDDFSSLRTLAHEMGHAIHSYRSKQQDVLYQGHSVVTAETASTFFEAVVGNVLMEEMTAKQKMIYLHSQITDKIATMIMCIARYLAELEMHETVRQDGAMTWQQMAAVQAKHFRNYCGSAIKVDDTDGLAIIAKTHYRRNFYQFSYSFGVIASSIMYTRYQQDASYASEVDRFLCAGEKASVDDIYKEIGIDTTKPAVFTEGINLLEQEIKTFEKLVKATR
jgi:oligoendopeptidase F